MIKIIPPDAWGSDTFARPAQVKVAGARFRGADFSAFVKAASHPLALWVRDNLPKPGEVYLHAIAMGSTERFGCFFAGAPVQTSTGLKPIEAIEIGDMVLTHKNRYRPVTHLFTGPYSGGVVTLKASGLPENIEATADHPFWVVRRQNFTASQRSEAHLRRCGRTKLDAINTAAADKSEFVRADQLVKGDYLIVPIRPEPVESQPIMFDPYLLGVYLAEGCVSREYRNLPSKGKLRRVVLTMSKDKDVPVIDAIRDVYVNSVNVRPSLTSDLGVRTELNSNSLAAECFRLFGGDSTTKRLHPDVFSQTTEWKLRFLGGYLDGDGCVTKTGVDRCLGTVKPNTASLNLAVDLHRLLASVGVASSVLKGWNRTKNGCFGARDNVIYSLNIGRGYTRELLANCERLDWEHGNRETTKQGAAQIGTDYMLVPLTRVQSGEAVDRTKYNIEVAEDNSYVVFGAVHNCNRNHDGWTAGMLARDHGTFEKHARWYEGHRNTDPAKSYGIIPKAWYDADLQRVDLIAALNATKEAADRNGGLVASRTLNKVAADQDVAVSMSARIPYDACVLCGHQAKNRNEYCLPVDQGGTCKYAGCRNALGRVYDDGKHQFVDNPHGSFFDLSDVSDTRGADRTAFVTGKVAAHYVPGGAELAERLGLVAPEHLLEPAALAQLRCLRKLAATRPTGPAPAWVDCVAVREKVAGRPDLAYPTAIGDYRAAGQVADLAAAGVVLPPGEWLHVTTGVARDKCAAALAGGVDPQRDLLARADLHDLLGGAYPVPNLSRQSPYAWLAPTARALGREAAIGCAKAAAAAVPAAALSPARAELAARYLTYQSAVLAAHENSANFPLLLADAARHTRSLAA